MSNRGDGKVRLMSVLCVVALIPAWLSISNHCALGAVAPEKPKVQSSECPFHASKAASEKQKPVPNGSPCCKILRAVSFNAVKHLPRTILDLNQAEFSFAPATLIKAPKIPLVSSSHDTGPPGKTTFAELIGSLRAHAPPITA